MMPAAASAPKKANAPALQSGSFQPPKSIAVAATPHPNAASSATNPSAIQPRRPAGMILASAHATKPQPSQRTMPIQAIIAFAGAVPHQFAWNSQGEAG